MLSTRTSFHALYGDLPATFGIRKLRHMFYDDHPEAFPYKSLRELLLAMRWPAAANVAPTPSYDYPREGDRSWMNYAQGVTHDDTAWYFTNQYGVFKFAATADLASDDPIRSAPIPDDLYLNASGWNHLGDPAFHDGLLYVPLEKRDKKGDAYLLVFDSELHERGRALFGAQTSDGPWCAVQPKTGLIYSSRYNDNWGPLDLYLYEPTLSKTNGLTLKSLGTMRLYDEQGDELEVRAIQGGAFSPSGHLYLVSDGPFARPRKSLKITTPHGFLGGPFPAAPAKDIIDGGVMGFDLITGRRMLSFPVDYQRWKDYGVTTERWQELEGITVWNRDAGQTPRIRGQIHVIMEEQDDDLFFKHYTCGAASDVV